MRISADKNDPGFQPGIMSKYDVYFEGTRQEFVVTADVEAGVLVRCMSDEQGLIVVDGELVEETLRGDVKLVQRN
ncbi:hypothetical protein H9643_18805 [Ochrobactrum sp. Sa2BUA5]|nr:hypothetical protein [Ochrobactrum gallinarum]